MKILMLCILLLGISTAYAAQEEQQDKQGRQETVSSKAVTENKPVITDDKIADVKEETRKEYTDLLSDVYLMHVYTVDELNAWVEAGTHLKNIGKVNECQFSEDIERRAKKGVASAYEFVYAEMLITRTCFSKDTQSGIYYLQQAAHKAYPAAMVKLAYYYEIGRYVEQNVKRAEVLMHEAAMTGYVPARIEWVGMLLRGLGSTKDYVEAYGWLHNSIPATYTQYVTSSSYLKQLSTLMPSYLVEKAKEYNPY